MIAREQMESLLRWQRDVNGELDGLRTLDRVEAAPMFNVRARAAVGDDSTDDRAALNSINTTAAADDGIIHYPPGTYRVASNLTFSDGVTHHFGQGALLKPDDGVTVTIAGPVVAGGYEIFDRDSTGIVKLTANGQPHNIAWWSGARLNNRWDFLRDGLETEHRYEVFVAPPHPNQTGAYNITGDAWGWEIDGALVFDDAENFVTWHQYARIKAVSSIARMMRFSPTNKIENVHLANGVDLDCNTQTATDGILINGCARITSGGQIRISSPVRGININGDTAPSQQIHLKHVHVGNFTDSAVFVSGTTNAVVDCQFDFVYATDYDGTAGGGTVVTVRGPTRDIKVGHATYRPNLGSTIEAIIDLETTGDGRPLYTDIGMVYSDDATHGVKARDTTGGSASKITNLVVHNVNINAASKEAIDWEYVNNSAVCSVGDINDITLSSTSRDNWINTPRRYGTLTDNGVRTVINGWGVNDGDPSSTGNWNGNGFEGVMVWDTTNNVGYVFRNGAWRTT